MRGGAIPLLVWGLILALLYALNVVWTGKGLDAAMAGFALAATLGTAAAFIALRPREALKKGEPPPSPEPQAISSASYGAVLLAVGVGARLQIVSAFAAAPEGVRRPANLEDAFVALTGQEIE